MKRYQIVKYNEHTQKISAVGAAYAKKTDAENALIQIAAAFDKYNSEAEWVEECGPDTERIISRIRRIGYFDGIVLDERTLGVWKERWQIIGVNFKD